MQGKEHTNAITMAAVGEERQPRSSAGHNPRALMTWVLEDIDLNPAPGGLLLGARREWSRARPRSDADNGHIEHTGDGGTRKWL